MPILQTYWESEGGKGEGNCGGCTIIPWDFQVVLVEIEVDDFKDDNTSPQAYFNIKTPKPKDGGVDAIYVQKASIQVASNLPNNSPIACDNSNK